TRSVLFVSAPPHTSLSGGNPPFPPLFFSVVTGRRPAASPPPQPLRPPGGINHCRDQRGLPPMAVSHHRHIPDVCPFIRFHEFAPGFSMEHERPARAELFLSAGLKLRRANGFQSRKKSAPHQTTNCPNGWCTHTRISTSHY